MAFSNYANSGPFVNNTVPPGINATFLNNVENFLDQIISSAVADSHITSDGNGNETAVSATLTSGGTGLTVSHNALVSGTLTVNGAGTGLTVAHNELVNGNLTVNGTLNLANGSIVAINFGLIPTLTSSGVTVSHGLGGTPGAVFGQILAGTGNLGSIVTYITSVNSSSFVISSSSVSGFAAYWIALR